jgi:phosphoribosyl-AMP cyclohydrolase
MSNQSQEERLYLNIKYDDNGLITCVTRDNVSKDILMVAFMNEDALKTTIQTGEMYYWSRSRQELWHKGATSGQVQSVSSLKIDCDQDCILADVTVQSEDGGACHTGRKSCFYRKINLKAGDLKSLD